MPGYRHKGHSMLDPIVWILCGWLIGISIAAALGWVSRQRLAWNGLLGMLTGLLGGMLLAPVFNMPPVGGFSLAASSVAVVSSIILCLVGNMAAWGARHLRREST